MVPDKFNMVDMEGIDLLAVQGETIPGLYNKLVESIALCRYQCVYNWAFNGILIPPTYVEMEEREDGVWINEGVMVDEEDVVHIASIEPEPPAPVLPVIESLSVTENGTYLVPEGVDGFNPVTVDVPSYAPVTQPLLVTENGTYYPPTGVDGYSPVTVDVSGGGSFVMVSASSQYSETYSPIKAFRNGFWGSNGGSTAWLKVDFPSAVKITGIAFGNTLTSGVLHWTSARVIFQASNDGSNWVDLYDAQNLSDDASNFFTFSVPNNNDYLYYRFLCYRNGSIYAGLGNVELIYD